MARYKGLLGFSGNYEPQKASAFDARANVPTKADLTDASNWTALDGNTYVYNGMTVTVAEDSTAENNGIYVLTDASDVTDVNNWLFVGSSGGGSTPTLDEVTDAGNTTTNNITVSTVNATTGKYQGFLSASSIGVNADGFNGRFEVKGISYQAGRVFFPELGKKTTGLKFLAIETGSLGGYGELTALDFSHFVSSSNTGSFIYSGSYNSSTSALTLYSIDTNYTLDLSGLAGGGGGGFAITASDEGTVKTENARSFDFVGNAVTATNVGNAVTVTINTGSLDNYVEWYIAGDADSTDVTSGKWVKFPGAASITGTGTEVDPYIIDVSGAVNTGSFYYSSSIQLNTITFNQGDGTTDTITVNTGSDTNIGNTNQTLIANRSLFFSGSSLTFDMIDGETFNIAAENNALVGIALDNSELQITGLATSATAKVLGIDASGNVRAMNTSSIATSGGGSTDTGSFYVSSSVSSNTITFNQGDGTTESVTVNTGSVDYSILKASEYLPDDNVSGEQNMKLVVGSVRVPASGTTATTSAITPIASRTLGVDVFVTATVVDSAVGAIAVDVDSIAAGGELTFSISTAATGESTYVMYHIFYPA